MIDLPSIKWGQKQRLSFIEQRLYWESVLSRSDLTTRFGISEAQASADIARYQELFPETVEFDRSRKAFVSLSGFSPKYFEPSARNYLSQLLLKADQALPSYESWLGREPAYAVIPRVRRKMDPETLRAIVMGIQKRQAMEIFYQSMTTADAAWRVVAPHAIAYDGSRWHARCWCYTKSRFADFVLARMLAIRNPKPSIINPELDRAWHHIFTMKLAPHPDLQKGQRSAIEMDFGMSDGSVNIDMRLCLTGYFERHYGLDIPESILPPWRRQIVLSNRDELTALREHCPAPCPD